MHYQKEERDKKIMVRYYGTLSQYFKNSEIVPFSLPYFIESNFL